MIPGTVMRSVMPWVPWERTPSAIAKASSMVVFFSAMSSSLSLGMTIMVSTQSERVLMPSSALFLRLRPSKVKGLVHDGDGQRTDLVHRDIGNNGSSAGTGATALAAGDEHHVGTPKRLFDIRLVVLGRLGSTLRVGTSTETTTGLIGKGNLDIRIRAQKILRIGIYRHKFNIL